MQKIDRKNIPNILSAFRIVLVIGLVASFFLLKEKIASHTALLVFIIAGITDIIDGKLARKNNCVSNLGKVLDPLADKLMQCAVLVCLAVTNMVELWFVLPYILKEFLVMLGGLIVLKNKKVLVVSNIFGKIAAFVFYVVIGLVLLLSTPYQENIPLWTDIICIISLCCTVVALIVYIFKYASEKAETNGAAQTK